MSVETESKQDAIFRNVKEFYSDPGHLALLTSILTKQSDLSLRLFDWLVTNYAKKYNVVYTHSDGHMLNVYSEYRNWLKGYSKRNFDPFKRRERIEFVDSYGQPLVTTVGQLNFFKFVIQCNLLQFMREHLDSIEQDMLANVGTMMQKRERKELTKAAISRCTKTRLTVKVNFT